MHRSFWIALVGALLSAGCSSSASEPTTTTEQTPTTTTAPQPTTTVQEVHMNITSPAFEEGDPIPAKYSCDGEDVSPKLDIAAIPDAAVALALVMDDPDAPGGTWDHWIAYDIIPVNTIEEGDHQIGTGGLNSWQVTGYGGPCPPSGTHRYFFKVYALDAELALAEGATKDEVATAMEGHVLADAQLMGTFARG